MQLQNPKLSVKINLKSKILINFKILDSKLRFDESIIKLAT